MTARVTRLEEIEPIVGAGIPYRLVRHTLGVRAFGVNGFTADAGSPLIEDHDEMGTGAARHEELYVVLGGRARFTVDGEEHDAPAGTLVFVPEPESRRAAVAVEDGTSLLVIGARAGEAYTVSPWEGTLAAKGLADAGDPAAAADAAAEILAQHPGNPHVLYDLACFEALAGRRKAALEHLRAAIEGNPESREWAAADADLDAVRDDPGFPG